MADDLDPLLGLNNEADSGTTQVVDSVEIALPSDANPDQTARQVAQVTTLPVSDSDVVDVLDEQLITDVLNDGTVGIHGYLDDCLQNMHTAVTSQPIVDYNGTGKPVDINENAYDNVVTLAVWGFDIGSRDRENSLRILGVQEAISFERIDVLEFESRNVEVKNFNRTWKDRLLGKNATVLVPQKCSTGKTVPMSLSKVIDEGKDEPAYRIGVIFPMDAPSKHGGGRRTKLDMVMYLPQSTALRLWEKVDKDPSFVRQIVDQVVEKKCGQTNTVPKFGDAFKKLSQSRRIYVVPPDAPSGQGVRKCNPAFYREF